MEKITQVKQGLDKALELKSPTVKMAENEINKNSLLKVMGTNRFYSGPLDEGIFPEEILENIEKRRKQLLQKIEKFVERSESKTMNNNSKENSIEEIKMTIHVILLEIDKLQAQIGSECVKECNRMIYELEKIHKKVKKQKNQHRMIYGYMGVVIIIMLWLIYRM